MINPIGGTARERLGKVIAFHIEQRKWNTRRVADTTSAPMQVVEAWKVGKLTPTGAHWGKLRSMVHRDLFNWTQLWQDACREQEQEDQAAREAKKQRRAEAEQRRVDAAEAERRRQKGLTVTLADKLQAALQAAPDDESDDEPLYPDLSEPIRAVAEAVPSAPEVVAPHAPDAPEGAPDADAPNGTQKRQNWMRSYFRQYQGATIDAALNACKATFGIGMNLDIIRRIRREVLSELQTPETVELEPTNTEAEIVQLAAVKTVAEPEPVDAVDENVDTAIQLLLDAIPNLRTFTLTIGDDGTPSVDFTERVVQIVEKRKSFQMKR